MMSLAAFLYADGSYNVSGWRDPAGAHDGGVNFERWKEFARILERGRFDMMFIADSASPMGVEQRDSFCRTARNVGFEPFTALAALSQHTSRLGLAATASTTWNEPYTIARMFASLDRICGGRSGWNLVTGRNPEDALNFSREEHVAHDLRYSRAEEFIDVCRGLWDSYDDDAIVADVATGQFSDPDKLHLLGHRGDHFAVRGPLNVARPPQGHPVIIQAGSSEPARELSARVADCMFAQLPDIADAQLFYRDVKQRMAKFGREPDDLKIMPGVSVYVGRTAQEAQDKLDRLSQYSSTTYAIQALGVLLDVDFSGCSPDEPIPPLRPNAMIADPEALIAVARRQNLTLGQYARRAAAAKAHGLIVGSVSEVADVLERWFREGAADGFMLLPPTAPGGLEDFVELVVPELQRRGLFRREYEGTTLREHLGARRPHDRSAP